MMASPIPDSFWKTTFHVGVAVLAGGTLLSLYNQRRISRSQVNAELKFLGSKAAISDKESEDVDEALRRLLRQDNVKSGGTRLTIQSNVKIFLPYLKLNPDSEDSITVVKLALQVLRKYCAADTAGRVALARADAYKKILALLSSAHNAHCHSVVDDAAQVLADITSVDESDVVLKGDVPEGAEGTLQLCKYGATLNMLRTLEGSARTTFLQAVTGIFAHLCTLQVGAQNLAKGIDGNSGAYYFLELLHHTNPNVVENSMRALRYLIVASPAIQAEICSEDNIKAIFGLLHVTRDAETVHQVIAVILTMLKSKSKADFFQMVVDQEGLQPLFTIWTNGSDAIVRKECEICLQILNRQKMTEDVVADLMDQNHAAIRERKMKDEDARKRQEQMNQMRQQQMMQQMMMGGGGGGGIPPEMMGMMGGMGDDFDE